MEKWIHTILFLFALGNVIQGSAADSGEMTFADYKDSASVRFRQSHTELDPNFGDNAKNLSDLQEKISKKLTSDTTLMIRNVHVVGGASPEGSVAFNRQLSQKRAEKIYDWFADRYEIADSVVDFTFLGRDWEGLGNLVAVDPNVPDREEVIEVINKILESRSADGIYRNDALILLKQAGGYTPYLYLYKNIFPELRESKVYISYKNKIKEKTFIFPDIPSPVISTVTAVPEVSMWDFEPVVVNRSVCRPFYMDLKTNLLYDALAIPNIGIEFYLGKQWSISADWMYGWWKNDNHNFYWRAYGGTVALRKWFGSKAHDKPLTGHHIGIYAGAITYDFELGRTGYMGGIPGGTLWDRCNYTAGVEYGYSLPVTRRLNIDFTLGIGYFGGKYVKYEPKNGWYAWVSTNKLNWFGPTKAEISIVWLIGCDNYNRGKGGKL